MKDGYIERRRLMQDIAVCGLSYDDREKVQNIIERQKDVKVIDRDEGKEPILESKTSIWHESRSDGKSGFRSKNFEDWTCPTCGWSVGELFSGSGTWHVQGEKSYCSRCGQRIDWTLPKAEEKKRYEERRAKEREEHLKENGIPLDNMNEKKRKKYGVMK